eukprot:scaffold265306_cov29-Tisochrysis_lutea.AAC.3
MASSVATTPVRRARTGGRRWETRYHSISSCFSRSISADEALTSSESDAREGEWRIANVRLRRQWLGALRTEEDGAIGAIGASEGADLAARTPATPTSLPLPPCRGSPF